MTNFIEIKNFNVLCGTSIRDAVKEGVEITNKYECIVTFVFNGCPFRIYNFDDEDKLVDLYYRFCQKDYLKFPEIYKKEI
jgi:hypothetical protein